jgi:hypothetical protein
MSCDVAASMTLWLAAVTADPHAMSQRLLLQPVVAVATPSLASEPLYADIVSRAKALKKQVERYKAAGGATADFDGFKAKVEALSALDMKGHLDLAKRGTDGDLKCILKGISQDLPKKLDEMAAATAGPARLKALTDMAYLLNDNVEVITAPPKPPV